MSANQEKNQGECLHENQLQGTPVFDYKIIFSYDQLFAFYHMLPGQFQRLTNLETI